jgi:hypothetical protein
MNRFGLLTFLLALALVFSSACNKPTNESITNDIKAKMFSEPLLKSSTINVSVKDGTVTLSGQLSDDAARVAAERIAADAKGVSKVIDQTTVPVKSTVAENVPPPAPAPAPARPSSRPAHTAPRQAAAPPSKPPAPANSSTEAPPSPAPAPAAAPAPAPAPAPVEPPPPPPPQPITVTLPEGTVFTVRTVDSIDSSTSKAGQTFRGSLDAPILLDGNVVVPKGLNVNLKLVTASSAGKFEGRSELTVALDSFTYQGKTYRISSSDVQEKGASRGKRSAAVIGGGAALGAIIGGIAGGGKGAAIGAAVGGGGGTAVQAATHGQQVRIPSETRLDFSLRDPLDVTYIPSKKSARSSAASPSPTADQPSLSDTQQPQ